MNKTLTNIMYFLGASLFAKLIGTMSSLVLARILEPANYGVWITLLLIASYAPIACFGTVETLLKRFPYHMGRGETNEAKGVENGVLGSIIYAALLVLATGFAFQHLVPAPSLVFELSLVRVCFMAAALSLFSAFFFHRLMAHQKFKAASAIDSLRAVLTFGLLTAFAWLWGLWGAVIGYLFSELLVLFFSVVLGMRSCGRLGVNFSLKSIWGLVVVGFPITLFWWIFMLQTSVDRIVSISLLGKVATGNYGLGVSIVSAILLLPQAVSRVIYPQVNVMVGERSSPKDFFSLIVLPTRLMNLALPFLIGILILGVPLLYYRLLPKYVPGIASAQILLLGCFFRLSVGNGANYLIATNRERLLLIYASASIMVGAAGALGLVKCGFNIEGIAVSTSVSGALLAILVWKSVFKGLGYSSADQWKELFGLFLPFLVLLGLLGVFLWIIPKFLMQSGPLVLWYTVLLLVTLFGTLFMIPSTKAWMKDMWQLIWTNVARGSRRTLPVKS